MPESVWDYPRPPRVEASGRRVRVVLGGSVIADDPRAPRARDEPSARLLRAAEDIAPGALAPSGGRASFCEWKGEARTST